VKKSKALLFQPFPLLGKKRSYRNAVFVGLFVTVFLIVFKPFGLEPTLTKAILFGVVTVCALVLCTFLVSLTSFYDEDSWKVYHQLLYYAFLLPVVGFANFLISDLPFTWGSFIEMVGSIMLIGIIPISASVFGKYFIQLKKNLRQAQQLTNELGAGEKKEAGNVTLVSENGKDNISLNLSQLLAIKSEDNYVDIFFEKDSLPAKSLLRNTLQNIEAQISNPRFFRCHRSWLVNMERVEKISGNSGGYLLVLPLLDEPVPVSRLRNADLKQRIGLDKGIPRSAG
jgi:hypothetical protein